MNRALRKYLEAGHTLADAAAYAGLGYDEARQQLTVVTDDADLDAQRLALASHAHAALETLNVLLGAECEKVRLTAAKTILELQVKHKPKGRKVEVSIVDDLWTTAAARSVHRNGSEAGDLEAPDWSSSEESFAGSSCAAADDSFPSMADHVGENPGLSSLDMPTDLFDLDSEDLPVGSQDTEDVRPPPNRATLSDGFPVSEVSHDPLHRQPDTPDFRLFDY